MGVAVVAAVVTGCGAGQQAAEEERRQEEQARQQRLLALMEEWQSLAENAEQHLANDTGTQIVVEMMQLSETGHLLILDELRDPDNDAATKVLAMHSLMPLVRTDTEGVLIVPQIRELAESTDDPLALSASLQLLAAPGVPELRPLFEEHADAEEVNVRLNALAGLARLGDASARDRLLAMAGDEDLAALQRDRALFEALGASEGLDREIAKRAVEAEFTTPTTRASALLHFAEYGDAKDRNYLLQLKERAGFGELMVEAIDTALARLNERVYEAATQPSGRAVESAEDGDEAGNGEGAGDAAGAEGAEESVTANEQPSPAS